MSHPFNSPFLRLFFQQEKFGSVEMVEISKILDMIDILRILDIEKILEIMETSQMLKIVKTLPDSTSIGPASFRMKLQDVRKHNFNN